MARALRPAQSRSGRAIDRARSPPGADELLDRILIEIRERERETQVAYKEARRLERALAALDGDVRGAAARRSDGTPQ